MTKGEDTRSEAIAKALALATQVGLEGLSIGKLAEHVGMSKSGLFAHFASKENLQVAVLDEAADRFVTHVVAPALKQPRGEPRVVALFERWLKWPELEFQPGGCIFIAASVELDDRPGIARDRLVATQRDWLDTIAGAASIAVAEKHFRPDLDIHQFAHEFYALAFGHHFLRRLGPRAEAESRTHRAFERLLADARSSTRRPKHV